MDFNFETAAWLLFGAFAARFLWGYVVDYFDGRWSKASRIEEDLKWIRRNKTYIYRKDGSFHYPKAKQDFVIDCEPNHFKRILREVRNNA